MGLLSRFSSKRSEQVPAIQTRIRDEVEHGRRLAIYDQVTGLLSPWYFELRLLEESHRCQRYGLSMVVLTLQASTHKTGGSADWWTLSASSQIRSVMGKVRNTDLVATLGPMEFCLCLIHCDRHGAAEALRRLTAEAEEFDWRIGMAVYPDDGCEGKQLLTLAQSRLAPWKVRPRESRAA